MSRNLVIGFSFSCILAGCSLTQEPVAVIDGYSIYPTYNASNVRVENLQWQEESLPELGKTSRNAVVTYTVEQGDSMHIIARKFNVPVQDIMDENGLPSENFLSIGQKLTIPQNGEIGEPVSQGHYSLTRSRFEENIQVTKKVEPKLVEAEPSPAAIVVKQHAVQPGETLYRIGTKYGVTPIDLMMYNNIDKPQDLRAGMLLNIPPKDGVVALTDAEKAAEKVLKEAKPKVNTVVTSRTKGMIWPVRGQLIKSFGEKGAGINHMGINIAADEHTPVLAAESGTVIYADNGLESYGNLILIRHNGGFVTAYAHNAKNMVSKNAKVEKGEVIAMVGSTGSVDRPQLHFEVRRNAKAVNPLKVLPR